MESNDIDVKPKRHRKKWVSYTFGSELLSLEPFDVQPVTDIPIRLAVEEGAIKKNSELALYTIQEEWNGHPKGSIVIAGKIEEGQPFAIWIGDQLNLSADNKDDKETENQEGQQTPDMDSPPESQIITSPLTSRDLNGKEVT